MCAGGPQVSDTEAPTFSSVGKILLKAQNSEMSYQWQHRHRYHHHQTIIVYNPQV